MPCGHLCFSLFNSRLWYYMYICVFFLTILNEICNLIWGEEKRLAKKNNGNIFWQTYLIQLLFLWIWSYPAKIYYIYLFCFLFAYLLDLMALQIFLRKTFLSVLLVTTTTMDIHLQAISKSLLSLYTYFLLPYFCEIAFL